MVDMMVGFQAVIAAGEKASRDSILVLWILAITLLFKLTHYLLMREALAEEQHLASSIVTVCKLYTASLHFH